MEQTIVVPGSYEKIPKHYSLKSLILGEKANGYDRIFGLAMFALPFALGWTSAITTLLQYKLPRRLLKYQ